MFHLKIWIIEAIFDEGQRVPELFSYSQQVLDEYLQKGNSMTTSYNEF